MQGVITGMLAIASGAAAGLTHVYAGPDHLAALAPIAMRDRDGAAKAGALWGLGHGLGVLLLGGLGLLLRSLINIDAISAWSEFMVGFLLVAVGGWALIQAYRKPDASHQHRPPPSLRAALGLGLFHGTAGTGHLFGVLPSLALPQELALLYLLAYLAAAVVSMSAFAFLVGRAAVRLGPNALPRLLGGAGVFAMGVGLFWIVTGWPLA